MRTGALSHPITIERLVRVGTTALGQPNFVWEIFLEPFASIAVMRGREHFDTGTKQRYSEDVYHFTCHYDDVVGLDATMRIVDEDGQRYDIKSIRPDQQEKRDCLIECTKQDAVVGSVALMALIEDVIPAGVVGDVYESFSVSAKGGTEPYSFSVAAGALPTGLALDTSTGAVTGTPTAAGTFSVTLAVTDADGDAHSLPAITVVVAAA